MTTTTTTVAAAESYLPDECWALVFKFLDDSSYNNFYLDPLSLVSKQFLSITNRLRSTLCIVARNPTRLFHRFTNVTTLDLRFYCGDIDEFLQQISCFSLKLTSLKVSNRRTIPADGLRAFSQNITTLTSLTCARIVCLRSSDLFLISDCFPLLEELNLNNPLMFRDHSNNFLNAIKFLSLTLFKLRKIYLAGHDYINDQSVFHLFKNCQFLEEVTLFNCYGTTYVGIERMSVENSNALTEFGIRPHLKSLDLGYCSSLTDERIIMFASVFPNLELLNLSNCEDISDKSICQVLRRCYKIRHLNLSSCSGVKLHGMNFEFPKLEELNFLKTQVDDETLYVISKNCRGLLQLYLRCCYFITEKGVKHVVENCTQLREIDLTSCRNTNGAALTLLRTHCLLVF